MLMDYESRTEILKSLMNEFGISEERAQVRIAEFESALEGETSAMFYHLLYMLNEAQDVKYAIKVFSFVFRHYLLLRDRCKREDRGSLDDFFEAFFKGTFGAKCHEYLRSDERDEAAISVLQHMSNRMNSELITQQEMIINLSHSMRTSLNAILGYINALKNEKPYLQGKQLYYLKQCDEESVGLQSLVSKILDLSKINSGQIELSKNEFWLEDAFSESMEKVLPMIYKKQLQFTSHFDLLSTKHIGDQQNITLIINHLLNNAVQFTSYGTIALSVIMKKLDERTDTLIFTIKDTGSGMSATEIKSVVNPFVRFSAMSDGVGTGLYIVSKLTQKMQGQLKIESIKGEGTSVTITLTLPRVKMPEIDLKKERFFFFNDTDVVNQDMFTQLQKFLEHRGATVYVVEDEKVLMDRLLNVNLMVPTYFVLTTAEENYDRFNGLIHYLKSMPRFVRTKFFAQHVHNHTLVNFFDNTFFGHIPISTYINLNGNKNRDILSKTLQERSLRILAVDDISTNLEVLKLFVKMLFPNAVLDMASGGYEAIGMYKTVDYDLLLLDLKMPGLDGYDVIKRCKAIKPLPPTFALTADVYKKTFEKITGAGFNGLLEKPIQPKILEESIKKALYDKNN